MGYQGRKQLKHSAEYVALKGCPLGRSSKGKDQVKLGAISYRWSSESTHVPLIFLPASFPVRLTTHTYARYIIVALEATDYTLTHRKLEAIDCPRTRPSRARQSFSRVPPVLSLIESLSFSSTFMAFARRTALSNRSSSNILVKGTRSKTLLYYITINLRRDRDKYSIVPLHSTFRTFLETIHPIAGCECKVVRSVCSNKIIIKFRCKDPA